MTHDFPRGRLDFEAHQFFIDGRAVRLRPAEARILQLLVSNRERIVPTLELGRLLNAGGAFEDNSVAQHISRLRKALGDPRLIRSSKKLGYQWVGHIGDAAAGSLSQPLHRVGNALALGLAFGLLLHLAVRNLWSGVGLMAVAVTSLVVRHIRAGLQAGYVRKDYGVADALTFIRPGIGLASFFAFLDGDIPRAFLWFLVGQISDMADGLIARAFSVESSHGRDWDALADAILTGAFGVGLLVVSFREAESLTRALCLVTMAVVSWTCRSQAHTVLDKVLSGVWRVSLGAMSFALLSPADQDGIIVWCVMALLGVPYEAWVLFNDARHAKRPLCRRNGSDQFSRVARRPLITESKQQRWREG